MTLSLLNLAETYRLAGDGERALEYALRGLHLCQEAGFELFEVHALEFLGKAHMKLGHPQQALGYLEQALELSTSLESKPAAALILLSLGELCRNTQQLDRALQYLLQAAATAQSIDARAELFKAHLLLSEIYQQQGDLAGQQGQVASLDEVFGQVLPRITEATRSRVICIHLLDFELPILRLVAQENLPGEVQVQLQTVELPPDFQRWLQLPNDPLVTTALAHMAALPPVCRLPGFQTCLAAQIRIGQRIAGLLSCYRFTGRGFGVDEVALVMALAEQIGMMLENHRLRQNVERMAILEERQCLARDLHDSVTQSLYSLSLFSRAGREAAEDGDCERLIYSLTELERNTLHTLREMRLLLYELRPADLEQEGLIRAVELRLNTVERRAGLQLDVHLDELPGRSVADELTPEEFARVQATAAALGETWMSTILEQNDVDILVTGTLYAGNAGAAGVPALTIPNGLDPNGWPQGIILSGPYLSDPQLIAAGYALEQALDGRVEPDLEATIAQIDAVTGK